ncbi:MAG: arylsulfatase [Planctomycetota bacterium]
MNRISTLLILLTFAVAARAGKPNVIVVMTDDQGYGEFSCHGNPIVRTPNIDRLASQSIRMTDFHAAPMCTPTRAQLMTGLDAFRTGAINVSSGRTLLKPSLKTMANVFAEAGYRTGLFGKWHLGDNYPFRPQDRGFDETLWFPSSHINSVPDFWDNDYFDDVYIHNGVRKKYSGYCTDVFFSEALKWIEESSTQPFFVYLPLNASHYPWFVPERYRDPIRKALEQNPEIVRSDTKGARTLENLVSFLAMGANIDENIGRLDKFLGDKGLIEDTVVVFLTDNGSDFGDKYFNAGMRGRKTQLWEGGHRVPCFLRYPNGDLGEPRNVSTLTHVQDLLPTLAAIASISDHVPKNLDGDDWGPMLRGEANKLDDRMLVINYSRMPMFNVTYTTDNPAIPKKNGAAVMWKSWRLIENRWLYNVKDDPHQDEDVAAEHPEIVKLLSQRLNGWWSTVKDDVMIPQRVVIGSDRENPSLLTACEWLDVFIDQQLQVRLAKRKNGTWYLFADQAGTYTFELRRYPRESYLELQAEFPKTQVTDGTYFEGRKLPIETAKLEVAGISRDLKPDASLQAFTATIELDEGPMEMRATFYDKDQNEVCGAYYVYVKRD